MKQITWVALAWIALITTAQAASFDCAKASTPQEKLICFDYRLSDLDSQLAWSYSDALKQSKDTSALKQYQKDWVAAREKCTDVNCIMHAYVGRIEALSRGSRLEEVYFPKAEIPWDFSPKPGYEVASYVQIKDSKLAYATFLKGTMTHGKDLIIPADDGGLSVTSSQPDVKHQLQDLGSSLVNGKFEAVIGTPVKLGEVSLAVMSSSYGECEGGLGMSGIYVRRNLSWTKNNVLVPLRPHSWRVWKNPGDDPGCQETDLKIDPSIIEAIVFNQSLYLSEYRGESDYVVRLDSNIQTASTLLGKKIYLGWGSDLEGLTGKACDKFVDSSVGFKIYSTEHRICIDQQLQKLIGEVGRFYN